MLLRRDHVIIEGDLQDTSFFQRMGPNVSEVVQIDTTHHREAVNANCRKSNQDIYSRRPTQKTKPSTLASHTNLRGPLPGATTPGT